MKNPADLLKAGKTKEAVELAFKQGWQIVSIGTDGGDGHVYRNSPLAEFVLRGGKIYCTYLCTGLEWIEPYEPAWDGCFRLPTYGKWWIR